MPRSKYSGNITLYEFLACLKSNEKIRINILENPKLQHNIITVDENIFHETSELYCYKDMIISKVKVSMLDFFIVIDIFL